MEGKAIIIGHTMDPDKITSSGARISTTKGDALAIFENATDKEKNQNLVRKVLASGHKTIVEHVSFNLAFVNVSAFVEQFMIEYRLASFTVKSRRYVDFSNMGFVVPAFVDKEGNPLQNAADMEKIYRDHMAFLFQEYENFVEAGVPKEDARFLLPYCYRSNFYCTVNARELENILYGMLYGRGSRHTELRELGQGLLKQALEICPFIYDDLSAKGNGAEKKYDRIAEIVAEACDLVFADGKGGEKSADRASTKRIADYAGKKIEGKEKNVPVELLEYTQHPEKVVARAALIEYTNLPTSKVDALLNEEKCVEQLIDTVISNRRPRELEQINFTFRINDISLAAITHLTRHRMQSIIIPPFQDVCRCDRYMIPETVKSNENLLKRYQEAYRRTKEVYGGLLENGLNKYEISYLYLSGNVIDITTTMNGRELLTFISLRTCNRAQWETRAIAIRMLELLREASPQLFFHFGPSCYVTGKCPEGSKACGRFAEVQMMFGRLM